MKDNIIVIQKTGGYCTTIKLNETGTLQSGGANVIDKVPNIIVDMKKEEQKIICDSGKGRKLEERDTYAPLRENTGAGHGNYIKVKSATKKGYEEAAVGDSINFAVPNSDTRRGRVGVANTLDTQSNQAVVIQVNPSKESGGKQPYQQNRVYDTDGIIPSLNSQHSKGSDAIIVAKRGRNIVDGKRKDYNGAPTEQRLEMNKEGQSNCLTSVEKDNYVLQPDYQIRRLTEIECERLQGFPDNHTEYGMYPVKKVTQKQMNNMSNEELIISFKTTIKKKIPKTQRYKLIGNAVTKNIPELIGRKLLNNL